VPDPLAVLVSHLGVSTLMDGQHHSSSAGPIALVRPSSYPVKQLSTSCDATGSSLTSRMGPCYALFLSVLLILRLLAAPVRTFEPFALFCYESFLPPRSPSALPRAQSSPVDHIVPQSIGPNPASCMGRRPRLVSVWTLRCRETSPVTVPARQSRNM
jgi:hypothetical protein